MTRCFAVALLATFAAMGAVRADEPVPARDRVLIPFDFESAFDEGRYGQIIGDLIWQKVQREGGFILPESMQDVRDWSERTGKHPTFDTPLDAMRVMVRDEQAGHLAIWGKVERAMGTTEDVYDIGIKVADFTTDPPRLVFERQARTKTVSEIPHTHIKAALDALYGRSTGRQVIEAGGPIDTKAPLGPDLVRGGLEQGKNGPDGWEPLPPHVAWIPESTAATPNHILRFEFPEDVAGGTGVLLYSKPFPVEEGATYRFECRYRTSGSAVKVFIKAYDTFATTFQGTTGKASQDREVYRSQQNLKGPPNVWNSHVEEFTPRHAQYQPRTARVMLYAYWPAGTVDWDDIRVRQVIPRKDPAPPSQVPTSRKSARPGRP